MSCNCASAPKGGLANAAKEPTIGRNKEAFRTEKINEESSWNMKLGMWIKIENEVATCERRTAGKWETELLSGEEGETFRGALNTRAHTV